MDRVMIINGDCRDVLRRMPDQGVHCCVTSPPYFGLRDYGVEGQIGLEHTPDEYVAKLVEVFREVRRVLRDDGTLWLNLGDSYASTAPGTRNAPQTKGSKTNPEQWGNFRPDLREHGIKPKDLIGIPWAVATALRDPYYTGRIKNEIDRVWLAAMMDAEGCITASEYETGGRIKNNIYISITNASVPIIDKCLRLFPQENMNIYEKGGVVNRTVFRWDVERMDQKALFIREIYPYLVAKRKQAILGYTFIEMQRGLPSKKKGYLSEQREQRTWLVQAIQRLNKGEDVDLPDWVVEPPSLFEPGFYLRQDIIWAKGVSGDAVRAGWSGNPMPESVRDRCTKAHEYIFMLSKSPKYHFDAEAIKEPAVQAGRVRNDRMGGNKYGEGVKHSDGAMFTGSDTRNRRSVWTVATEPFSEAHFAVFPPSLVEPCILAGCPKGGTVIDPFGGSGTTGLVADRLGRNAVLIELNPEYAEMARRRIEADAPLFAGVELEPAHD